MFSGVFGYNTSIVEPLTNAKPLNLQSTEIIKKSGRNILVGRTIVLRENIERVNGFFGFVLPTKNLIIFSVEVFMMFASLNFRGRSINLEFLEIERIEFKDALPKEGAEIICIVKGEKIKDEIKGSASICVSSEEIAVIESIRATLNS